MPETASAWGRWRDFLAALAVCCRLVGGTVEAAEAVSGTDAAKEEGLPDSEIELREEQLKAVETLVQENPESDDARYLLGLVYQDRGDSVRAMQYWRESIEMDATRADAHHDLGRALLLRESFDEALEHLEAALRLAPNNEEYAERLAYGRIMAGRYEEALQGLDKAGTSTALAQRFRGQVLQRLGRYPEAKAAYESALRMKPGFAEAHYGLVGVCRHLGETEAAREHQQQFSELNSESQRQLKELRRTFDPAREVRSSVSRTHSYAAQVYQTLGRVDMAEKLWMRSAELAPSNVEARLNLTRLYYASRRIDQAIQMCREMIRAEPEVGSHYLSLGNLLRQQQQLGEAEEAYRKVVLLAPERPEGFYALTQVLLETGGDLNEAETLARRAVEIAQSPTAYYLLTLACAAQGDFQGAVAASEQACQLASSNSRFCRLRDEMRRRAEAVAR